MKETFHVCLSSDKPTVLFSAEARRLLGECLVNIRDFHTVADTGGAYDNPPMIGYIQFHLSSSYYKPLIEMIGIHLMAHKFNWQVEEDVWDIHSAGHTFTIWRDE